MIRWKLTGENYEFIKGEVIHIFVKYNIKCIPVSGFEIATKMGIVLVPYGGLSTKKLSAAMHESRDGFYIESGGKEYIFYNNIGKNYERQNMTILHEIGHCVLDHTGHSKYEEDEANFFAKYAIAPPVLVEKIGAVTPSDIYSSFNISYEAAVYAFDYYLAWKQRHDRLGKYTEYEKRLLAFYKKSA
ncbi:MAG: ImmA/IrrE family metallo-endopeptidase [Lachnospiraceae bacterium]|nr:ImmA/IrrE family metallo-endopeptidase [Lachnospiraceae bacterium]